MLGGEKISVLKDALRASIKKQLASIDANEKQQKSQKVTELFLNKFPLKNINTISIYHPIGNELDTLPLMEELVKLGKKICLPVMTEEESPMIFREYKKNDTTCLDNFYRRVQEPLCSAETVQPDLIILPLLAFDGKGNRLGYGRGYYDRTLYECRNFGKKIIAVGVGYGFQRVKEVPHEDFDEKLDYGLSEKGLEGF